MSMIVALPCPAPSSCQTELLECFELGEREAFFALWDHGVPSELRSHDPTCLNVEFNLSLYFAVHCYRHGQEHKVMTCCGREGSVL